MGTGPVSFIAFSSKLCEPLARGCFSPVSKFSPSETFNGISHLWVVNCWMNAVILLQKLVVV